MRFTTPLLPAAACLAALSASAAATEYNSTVKADSTAPLVTLEDGDIVDVSGMYGLHARDGGVITLSNPATDGITIRATGDTDAHFAVYAQSGAKVNLGSGSEIHGETRGVRVSDGAGFEADNLNIVIGSESSPTSADNSRGLYVVSDSWATLGSDSSITVYGESGARVYGIRVLNDKGTPGEHSTVRAGDNLRINIIGSGHSISAGIAAGSNGSVYSGTNAVIKALGARGVSADRGGLVDIGENSKISAALGIYATMLGKVTVANSSIEGLGDSGTAVMAGPEGIVELTGSSVYGAKNAIVLHDSSAAETSGASKITVNGGTVFSELALIRGEAVRGAYGVDAEVLFAGGAKASSANGALYQSASGVFAGSRVFIRADGAGTDVSGVVLGGGTAEAHLTVSNGASWSSFGTSRVEGLSLAGANVSLTLNSTDDAIYVGGLYAASEDSVVNIDLTNSLLMEILEAVGEDPYLLESIVTGSFENDLAQYVLSNVNADGSTWSYDDLGNGKYLIYNIHVVPEPAVVAAIAGILVFGFAVLRRRK